MQIKLLEISTLCLTLFLSTWFGVGGDEKVRWIGTKSPDAVPVVGDVVHERHSSDWDEREACEGGPGLMNSLAISHFFLLWHFYTAKSCLKEIKNRELKSASFKLKRKKKNFNKLPRSCLQLSVSNTHCWFANEPHKSQLLMVLFFLIVSTTVSVFTSLLNCHYLLLAWSRPTAALPCFLLISRGLQHKSPPRSECGSRSLSAASQKQWTPSWSLSASVTLKRVSFCPSFYLCKLAPWVLVPRFLSVCDHRNLHQQTYTKVPLCNVPSYVWIPLFLTILSWLLPL